MNEGGSVLRITLFFAIFVSIIETRRLSIFPRVKRSAYVDGEENPEIDEHVPGKRLKMAVFPRVGKAQMKDTHGIWPEVKRLRMTNFPRVGRSQDMTVNDAIQGKLMDAALENDKILQCTHLLGSLGSPDRKGIRPLGIRRRYGNNMYPVNIHPEQKRLKSDFPQKERLLRTRSEESEITEKRSDANNGMWFGPRLGRTIHKNEDGSLWIPLHEYPFLK
ncbi:hypothetical protein JTB14_018488 [Gonioctena quinquepunctata]|nr:hypothetical protein JTB14_018488 [Gonioctena quinquepunctata]